MTTPRITLLLPMLVASMGVAVLMGCIPIPVYRPLAGGPRPEERIGKPGSKKPLRLGHSTRQNVQAILGYPSRQFGKNTDVYVYPIITFTLVMPCTESLDSAEDRFLRLDYDEAGVLRRFQVLKQSPTATENPQGT